MTLDTEGARSLAFRLQQNIRQVIVGKDQAIELMLIALICKGHILLEDVPGVGKTTLAGALARSVSCSFSRIQFTPDVTPSDVTGYTMLNMGTGKMEFKPGAVMSQIVLADEINRTSPKTQSSLLEAMEERQVTVDGVTHTLPQPFMVMAPQVYSSPELRQYIAEIAAATRQHPMLSLGVSPRGAIALLKAAQALALLSGRDYVLPDDVRQLLKPVLAHRLQLTAEARMKVVHPEALLDELAATITVPVKRRV